MADRIIFAGTLVLAGIYFWATSNIPTLEIGDPLGPKAFPRLLGIGLVLGAIMLALEMWRARDTKPAPAPATGPRESNGHYGVVAAAAVLTLIYFLVFEKLGYMLATAIYLIALFSYFNKKRRTMNLLTAILFAVISYFVFTQLLGVNLPRGIIPA
jgi:putative tricarboxylic transport membrane protein